MTPPSPCVAPSVYRITNRVNGMAYIGMTTSCLRRRFDQHLSIARNGGDTTLSFAIQEFGEDAFSIEALVSTKDWADLCELETLLIQQYGTAAGRGYNVRLDGQPARSRAGREAGREADVIRRIHCVCNVARAVPDTTKQSAIGRRVKDLRKALRFSQEKLARLAGVSTKTIHRLERGHISDVRVDHLFVLATALETSAEFLLFGREPESSSTQGSAPPAAFDANATGEAVSA